MQCPKCKSKNVLKVIWMGFPIKLCDKPKCQCLWGLWSFLPMVLPFDGWFMTYEGSYVKALWHWLWHLEKEE